MRTKAFGSDHAGPPALSTLSAHAPQAEFAFPADATNGFTVKFKLDFKRFEGEKPVLEIPNVLGARLRQHDPRDRNRQNYPAFNIPDGSVPVLEATLTLPSIEHPDWKEMMVGIPLGPLDRLEGQHDGVLNFSGANSVGGAARPVRSGVNERSCGLGEVVALEQVRIAG